jgi:hypothetical protein
MAKEGRSKMAADTVVTSERARRERFRAAKAILFAICGIAAAAVSSAAGARPSAEAAPAQNRQDPAACAQKLPDIELCIANAARTAMRDRDVGALSAVAAQLRARVASDKGPALHYRSYWLAYADFLTARVAIAKKQTDQARAAALEADTLLDRLEQKDQETYALQNLVVLVQFPLSTQSDMGRLIAKLSELHGKLGDAASVRALYARAQADFYTPKEYGGGQLAEKLLRQALAAPEEPHHPLKPGWGRDDCAALLVRIVKASGRAAEARSLYAQWQRRYPDSLALGQLTGMQ